jgi:hypothetical protein
VSAVEILVRLVAALLFMLAGTAVLLPALGDRRGLLAVVLVAIGADSFSVAVCWPPSRDGDR